MKKTREEKLFRKATEKLRRELDVIALLKGVNQANLLVSSLLTRKQQILINFQKKYIIETTASDATSSEDMKENLVKKMESADPKDRLFAMAKVKSVLNDYSSKGFNFEALDQRLIKGMFHRTTDYCATVQK